MKRSSPQLLLLEQLNQFIKSSTSERRLTPSGKRITSGTITNYKHVFRLIDEYENNSGNKLRIHYFIEHLCEHSSVKKIITIIM